MDKAANIRKEGRSMRHYISQAMEGFGWKAVASVGGAVISALGHFYTPLVWGFLAMFLLDLASGILKSYKKGIPITSKRLRDSVSKLAGYMILITALIIASKYREAFVPVVSWSYYFFMFTEFKSIIENVQEMGVKVPKAAKKLVDSEVEEEDKKDE